MLWRLIEVMRRRKTISAPFLLLAAIVSPAQAQPGQWQYLGEANVDGAADHDMIRVSNRTAFRAIRIRVENSAVTFDRVIVHYGNGQAIPIQIARTITAGNRTRVIDLPGERRYIDSVEFFYRRGNWNNSRKPKVRLFGMA
jgi:hypothetical protein